MGWSEYSFTCFDYCQKVCSLMISVLHTHTQHKYSNTQTRTQHKYTRTRHKHTHTHTHTHTQSHKYGRHTHTESQTHTLIHTHTTDVDRTMINIGNGACSPGTCLAVVPQRPRDPHDPKTPAWLLTMTGTQSTRVTGRFRTTTWLQSAQDSAGTDSRQRRW